jgi:GNAT superfamily N-acetyltransferase
MRSMPELRQLIFREATTADIPGMHIVRMSVKENALSNPLLVQEKDYAAFITTRGKGWVCELDGVIVGFAIVDTQEKNVWALFVDPAHERKGIGRKLHDMMLDWYFSMHEGTLWLSTSPGTRAESVYAKAGWTTAGTTSTGETKFEISADEWNATSR